jgi:hypothetical protein
VYIALREADLVRMTETKVLQLPSLRDHPLMPFIVFVQPLAESHGKHPSLALFVSVNAQ